VLMAIPPTDIRIIFTNYDIIAYFLKLVSCSEHFISIKQYVMKSIKKQSAKGPDKGKIVNKLYCILLTTLELP
jgi:hypothetical protein